MATKERKEHKEKDLKNGLDVSFLSASASLRRDKSAAAMFRRDKSAGQAGWLTQEGKNGRAGFWP